MTKWLPIESAPKDGVEVLTWDGDWVRVAEHAHDDFWRTLGLATHKPTHWMPLPEPPKENDDE